MGAKITWDSAANEGVVTIAPDGDGVIDIDVTEEIWSDAVVDWSLDVDLRKRAFPLVYEGGVQIGTEGQIGATFLLLPPWKIRLYDAEHELRPRNGVLRASDGTRWWLPPLTASGYAVIPAFPDDVVALIPPTATAVAAAVWSRDQALHVGDVATMAVAAISAGSGSGGGMVFEDWLAEDVAHGGRPTQLRRRLFLDQALYDAATAGTLTPEGEVMTWYVDAVHTSDTQWQQIRRYSS